MYSEWKHDPNRDYAVVLPQESETEDHIYSTLSRQDSKRRDSFENDEDDVYATVNFVLIIQQIRRNLLSLKECSMEITVFLKFLF